MIIWIIFYNFKVLNNFLNILLTSFCLPNVTLDVNHYFPLSSHTVFTLSYIFFSPSPTQLQLNRWTFYFRAGLID